MTADQLPDPPQEPDDGHRRMMTLTFIALAVTLVMTVIAVYLVVYFFDRP